MDLGSRPSCAARAHLVDEKWKALPILPKNLVAILFGGLIPVECASSVHQHAWSCKHLMRLRGTVTYILVIWVMGCLSQTCELGLEMHAATEKNRPCREIMPYHTTFIAAGTLLFRCCWTEL